MLGKRLKNRLQNRQRTMGSWITIPSETTAEIMAQVGFDWLVIDMEHGPIGIGDAARLIRTIDLAGIPVLCRLPSNDQVLAKKVLDAGAAGIVVPMIESKGEACRAVEAAYYPPRGTRGVGLARAQGYGWAFETYCKELDESIVVIVMIESGAGVENAEAIASTSGVDGILIGPYDISASLGYPGQLEHSELVSAEQKVLQAAKRANIGCGIHVVHPEHKNIDRAVKAGYTFLVVGVDMIFLGRGAREGAAMSVQLDHSFF